MTRTRVAASWRLMMLVILIMTGLVALAPSVLAVEGVLPAATTFAAHSYDHAANLPATAVADDGRSNASGRPVADASVRSLASLGELHAPGAAAASDDIAVIGRQWDTAVAKDWTGHEVLDIADWTIARNDAWVRSVIDRRMRVYIGSPESKANLWDPVAGRSTVFGREVQQFLDAGYVRDGHYLLPPGG